MWPCASHLLPHSCRMLSWPPVPTWQARHPSIIFWFLKGSGRPIFQRCSLGSCGGCALLCPKMLQGASESYLASLSCLCQAIFLHILATSWADLLYQPAKQGSLQLFFGSWRGSGSLIFQRCSLSSCGGCALLCPKMPQGASESYLASLSCLCQAIFLHILAASWADLLCQPAKQGSLQLFFGSWRGSGSLIFQRCSLGSYCGCVPSKAAFNYFLVPEGGQGASFSRGAALAPVVAVLCCAPKMPQGASESYLASLSCLCQAIFLHILAASWADLLCQPAKQGSLQLFFGSWRGSGSLIFQRCSLGSCGGCVPSKAAFNYFLVPEGGQGASFSRGAALAPVVAVLCCAPKMLQGASESYLARLSCLCQAIFLHILAASWADLLCQPAKQGSLQLFFWFLKGVREPHFPEVQPWLLLWLCAKQGSLQLFFGSWRGSGSLIFQRCSLGSCGCCALLCPQDAPGS